MKVAIISALSVFSFWILGYTITQSYNTTETKVEKLQKDIKLIELSDQSLIDTINLLKHETIKCESEYLKLKVRVEYLKTQILNHQTTNFKNDFESLPERLSKN